MKVKKVPQRMCLGCQEMKSKKELIRVVKNQTGEVKVDLTGKLPGRGSYICKSVECFEKAIKAKRFDRALETKLSEDIYQRLKEELTNA